MKVTKNQLDIALKTVLEHEKTNPGAIKRIIESTSDDVFKVAYRRYLSILSHKQTLKSDAE